MSHMCDRSAHKEKSRLTSVHISLPLSLPPSALYSVAGSMNKCDKCQLTPTSKKKPSLKCLNKFALGQKAQTRQEGWGLLNWLAGIEGPRCRYVHMHKLSSKGERGVLG